MTRIAIDILHGNRSVTDEDRERAIDAAEAVLAAAETTRDLAAAEFRRQWEEFDDRDMLTGLARVWIEAEDAADLALTEGWANPDGASCALDSAA